MLPSFYDALALVFNKSPPVYLFKVVKRKVREIMKGFKADNIKN